MSAVTYRHPEKTHANSRSVILFRYQERQLRVSVATNHDHIYGAPYEESFIKWEGTAGAIRAQMGLLLDYPTGGPDKLEIYRNSQAHLGWQDLDFSGSWFPDAFIHSMGALQRYVNQEVPTLPTSVADVYQTMATVEAAYTSAAQGGVVPDYQP